MENHARKPTDEADTNNREMLAATQKDSHNSNLQMEYYLDENISSADGQDRPSTLIYILAKTCDGAFANAIEASENPLHTVLSEYQERFRFWVAYMGVFASYKASLDFRVRRHSLYQRLVVNALCTLRDNIHYFCPYEEEPSDDSDSNDNESKDPDRAAMESIGDALQRLNRFAIALRHSSTPSYPTRIARFYEKNKHQSNFRRFRELSILTIEQLYPSAPETLRTRLSDSMLDRYIRISYSRSHERKLKSERSDHGTNVENTANNADSELHGQHVYGNRPSRTDQEHTSQLNSILKPDRLTRFPVSDTEATPLTILSKAVPLSGVPRHSPSRAASSAKLGHIAFPDPPKLFDASGNGTCMYCRKLYPKDRFEDEVWWKDHVEEDLQPYPCIFGDCDRKSSFSDRRKWSRHMSERHGNDWAFKIPMSSTWICQLPRSEGKDPCEREFRRFDVLADHQSTFHPGTIPGKVDGDKSVYNGLYQPYAELQQQHLNDECPLCQLPLEKEPEAKSILQKNKTPNNNSKSPLDDSTLSATPTRSNRAAKRVTFDISATEDSAGGESLLSKPKLACAEAKGSPSQARMSHHIAAHLRVLAFVSTRIIPETLDLEIIGQEDGKNEHASSATAFQQSSSAIGHTKKQWNESIISETIDFPKSEDLNDFKNGAAGEILGEWRDEVDWSDIGFGHRPISSGGDTRNGVFIESESGGEMPSRGFKAQRSEESFTERKRAPPLLPPELRNQREGEVIKHLDQPRDLKDLDHWKRGEDFRNLRELLKKIQIQHADSGRHFWTDTLLIQAITRDRVIEELESHRYDRYRSKEEIYSLLDHILPNNNDPNKDHGFHNSMERDKSWIMDHNRFFKIFVVLIWSVRGKDIEEFIKQGICDDYLPMFDLGDQEKIRSWSGDMTEAQRKCFSDWEELSQEAFERDQYEFMIPYLGPCRNEPSSIRDVKYISETILPWIAKDTDKGMIGVYGGVSCVTPHHTSHGFQDLKQVKAARGVFAQKTIIKNSDTIYENKGRMLRLFSGRHDHLLTLLMTFTLGGYEHFLFPWAECDLEIFWRRSPAPYSEVTKTMDQSKIKWMSKQIVGITSALQEIHCPQHLSWEVEKFARHGNIKPENIFWFPSNEKSQGMLVIGDFGIASIHGDKSKSNVPNQSVPHSSDYRPPECDQEGGVISRAFDIWTLGCLLMEMVCWALGGASMIDDFDKERSTVPYIGAKKNIWFDLKKWNDEEYVVVVKETVTKWMRKLSEHEGCTEYIHDLLSVINDHMLVVLSSSADRIISEELLKKFKEMDTKVHDHAYGSKPWKSKKIFPEPVAVKTKLNHMAKQRIANRKDLLVNYTGSQVQEAKTPKEMTNVDGATNDYLNPVP